MKRIFVPTEGPGDWQRLLAKPQLHWKKGASAMTAATAWEETPESLPQEIETILSGSGDPRLVHLTLLAAIPEWETALEGGERNSHTDVLALARNDAGLCVIAVVAKVNEDFGPLASEKRKGASEGQDRRIKFLEGLLRIERLDDTLRYQFVHRTASALLTARAYHAPTAIMLVQSFGHRASLRFQFDQFCNAFGAKAICPGLLAACQFEKQTLFLAWCQGDPRFLERDIPSRF